MKRNRFASVLLTLTGKVATLPILVGQVRADITPSYADMIGSDLRVIEIPVGSAIRLQSIATDANAPVTPAASAYAAAFCTDVSLPATTTIVVTGVNAGDQVVVAAATNKNDPFHLQLDGRLTLGTQGLTILGSAQIGSGLFNPVAGGSTRGTISFNVSTEILTGLAADGKFYIQAAVIPVGAIREALSGWQFSELDEIRVGSCAQSPYGAY